MCDLDREAHRALINIQEEIKRDLAREKEIQEMSKTQEILKNFHEMGVTRNDSKFQKNILKELPAITSDSKKNQIKNFQALRCDEVIK